MALIKQIKRYPISIAIAMPGSVPSICEETIEGIKVYILPITGRDKEVSPADCDFVIKSFNPDLIQIEGTEFRIQNEFSKDRGIKRIVSLQGILEGYAPYQYGMLADDDFDTWANPILNRVVKSILHFRKNHYFNRRLKYERNTLSNADYFTGRTFWDRAHSYWANPRAPYFKCNRILRDSFYEEVWSIDGAVPYRIYTSNGSSALKGLHYLLKAVGLLRNEYPDIKLYIAGPSSNRPVSIKDPKAMGYPLYVRNLIKRLGISENVVFTGTLQESGVAEQLKKANVYVLPSLIENSPNSLGEAMLMGVPCVASYAGGVSDMASVGEVGMYRSNDPALLAWELKKIFDSKELQRSLSANARARALVTHDKKMNAKEMVRAYESITGCVLSGSDV